MKSFWNLFVINLVVWLFVLWQQVKSKEDRVFAMQSELTDLKNSISRKSTDLIATGGQLKNLQEKHNGVQSQLQEYQELVRKLKAEVAQTADERQRLLHDVSRSFITTLL